MRRLLHGFSLTLALILALAGHGWGQIAEGNSDKDGIQVPTFPVPEGSVSISNSGESLVSFPLAVPPGVRNMAPKLSLGYSSATRDRGLGPGWTVELGYPDAVRRETRFGVPRYDATDVFTYDGQDLVPAPALRRVAVGMSTAVSASALRTRYHTRVESFRRILFTGAHWEVTEPDGTRLVYGDTSESRSTVDKGVYAWHLTSVSDPLGNTIVFSYEEPGPAPRLTAITYTLDGSRQVIARKQEVLFDWEPRPDSRTDARYGSLVLFDHRLRAIETRSGSKTVRTYELCYAGDSCTIEPEPLRRHSLLVAVLETAADGTRLPARELHYQQRSPGWVEDGGNKTPLAFANHWRDIQRGWRLSDTGVRMCDVNGDGMVDQLHSNPYTQRNKGHGEVWLYSSDSTGNRWKLAASWQVPYQFVSSDGNLNTLDLGVRALDVNGDGLCDLLNAFGATREVRLNNGTGWDPPGEYVLPDEFEFVHGVFEQQDGGTRTGDVNGDGLPDLLKGSRYRGPRLVYLNNGTNGWAPAPAGSWELPLDFVDLDDEITADLGVRLIDVNADGLDDLVHAANAAQIFRDVWLNDGAGWELSHWDFPVPFYNLQVISGLGLFFFDFGVQVADVDGDGYPDVVFAIPGQNNQSVYLNDQSGSFIEAPDWEVPVGLVLQVINGPSSWYYADSGVRVLDVNNDGLADLVRGAFLGGVPVAKTYLARPARADLLATYTNPLGGLATIDYRRVSGFGTEPGRMPFGRTVASKLSEDGGLDPAMDTAFSFDEGLYDSESRDFRGFQHVVETYADGTRREREFYLDEGRKGKVKVETRRDNDGKAYEETRRTYSSVQKGGVFTTLLTLEDFTQFHQDDEESMVFRRKRYTYDGYGNVLTRRQHHWGTMERECEEFTKPPICIDVRRAGPVARSERRSYAVNTAAWIVDRPASVEHLEGDLATSLSVEESYYDGLGLGQVSHGLLTGTVLRDRRLEGLVLYGSDGAPGPVQPGSSVVTTTFQHDTYGNVIQETNGRGFTTSFDYAPNGYLFPATTRRVNPSGIDHVRQTQYDLGLGVVTTDTDPNGNTTSYSHDGLGRLLDITLPDDPPGDPSIRVTQYGLGTVPAFMEVEERLDTYRTRSLREYVDGLGRRKAMVRGAYSTWVMSELTRFDNRGRRQRVYEPFFRNVVDFTNFGPSVTLSTAYAYEDDKVSVTTHPGGGTTKSYYGPDYVTETDENGEQTTKSVDAFGQVFQVTNAAGTAHFDYDGLGGLRESVDPQGLATQYFYDARGLLRGVSSPDGAQSMRNGYKVWNDYDGRGNHTYHWSGSDVWRKHYDALDRETRLYVSRDYERALKAERVFVYDRGPNAVGRLTLVIGYGPPLTRSVLSYDARGRVTRERFLYGNLDTTLSDLSIRYLYNRQGEVTSIQDPRGRWIEYRRDFLGQIRASGGHPAIRYNDMWPDRISNIDYDPSGRMTGVHYGHNVMDVFGYDARGRMISIAGSGPLALTYRYDAAGNLLSESGSGVSMTYGYDSLHRLTASSGRIGTTNVDLSYQHDASGNLLSVSGVGGPNAMYRYLAGTNRLSSVQVGRVSLTVAYDPKGNLTDLDDSVLHVLSRSFTYDGLGRLRAYATAKTSGSVVYDGRGRKVQRTLPGGGRKTYFHLADGEVLATFERDAKGTARWMTYLLAQGKRLARVDHDDAMRYLHFDRLGSARAATSYKARSEGCFDEITGKPVPCPPQFNLLWKTAYLPYGAEVEPQGQGDDFRFTGQELDENAGLYDYGARSYDPLLRRFLQIDSFLGVPNDPKTLNRYAYGLGNPLTFVDPTGHMACDPVTDPDCEEELVKQPEPKTPEEPETEDLPLTSAKVDKVTQPVAVTGKRLPPETRVWKGRYGQPVVVYEQKKEVTGPVFDVSVSFYNLGYSLRKGPQFDSKIPVVPGFSINKDGFSLGPLSMSKDGFSIFGIGATTGTETVTFFAPRGAGTPVYRAEITTYFSNGSSTTETTKLK